MNAIDDRLERELDAWWDDKVLARSRDSAGPVPPDIETIRALHAIHAPAAPTPAFVHSLKEDLMNQAILNRIAAPKTSRRTSENSRLYEVPAWRQTPITTRRRGPAWLQVAVAAALILGLIGAAYGGGLLGGSFSDQPTSIPAVLSATKATATPAQTTSGPVSYRGDASHSGQMAGPAPVGVPTLAWRADFGSDLPGVPAYDNGRLFVLTSPGIGPQSAKIATGYPNALVAMDFKTGKKLWTISLGAPQLGMTAPTAASGIVVAITTAGIVGIDEGSGAVAWSYPTNGSAVNGSTPSVADDAIYVTIDDGTLRSIDLKTGKERWRFAIPVDQKGSAGQAAYFTKFSVTVSNGIVYGVSGPGLLFALDAKDGHSVWTFQAQGVLSTEPVVDGAVVYLAAYLPKSGPGTPEGRLYALDAASGKQLWTPKKFGSPFTVSAGEGMVFAADAIVFGGRLTAFDGSTGKQAWIGEYPLEMYPPIVVSGQLIFEGLDGNTKAVDARTGKPVWSVFLNGSSAPIVVDGLLIASSGNTTYAVGGNGGLAAQATPTPTSADFSGLSACTPPRAIPIAKLTGTPKATIDAETQLKNPNAKPEPAGGIQLTIWPQLLTANVPAGPAASSEQLAQIKATLGSMDTCQARADSSWKVQGFFTDDFFRRGFNHYYESYGYLVTWLSLRQNETVDGPLTTVVLKDGRVAIEVLPKDGMDGRGEFIIFAQQDGKWLIDEAYRLMDAYNWVEPG